MTPEESPTHPTADEAPLQPADREAAHQFLTELRTRIATQPLPYQHGVESRALESLFEVFGQARAAIKDNPGCETFARETTAMLNVLLRPLTAKWHRALEEGRLASRDGADEFRGELQEVQVGLRAFAGRLHRIAYGESHADELTPEVMDSSDLDELFAPVQFGVVPHSKEALRWAANIARDEGEAVARRRESSGRSAVAPGMDAIGLALSGGGIRSSTFGLGVVQVLAQRGFLREFDFLSTVSGGGYTGTFLTRNLGNGEPLSEVAGPRGPDPCPVRYVRLHAKFISAYNIREAWAMMTASLAGLVLNLSAPLLVIVLLAVAAGRFGDAFAAVRPAVMAGCGVLSFLAMLGYGIGIRCGKKAANRSGWILAGSLALTAVIGAGWAFEVVGARLLGVIREHWRISGGIGTVVAALVAGVPTAIRFLPVLKNPKGREFVLKGALVLAGLVVPVSGVLLFYLLSDMAKGNAAVFLVVAAFLAGVSFFVLNVNLTSPHRMYRGGLAKTFVRRCEGETSEVPLTDINPAGTAPYHLINATVNVPSSENTALKDRGCDFFLFSKHWVGSMTTGYERTARWKANGDALDLATAMAVSGAAFAPHMGLGSNPLLASLMTLLNVRLGFWIKKPSAKSQFSAPGIACLLREMSGLGMSEHQAWLHLSDGGHIENLAVYELLRRRCKFIVCVDGEADPNFTFHGFMTLVRHAQIDFGIRITPRLDDLRPDPATGLCKSHFHLCRVEYPGGDIGLLLYIKLSVTGNEAELIKRYRITHPEFPHQPTLDQFFDQEQWESYRHLGVHACEGMFQPSLMGGADPADIPAWFRQLARSTMEPS